MLFNNAVDALLCDAESLRNGHDRLTAMNCINNISIAFFKHRVSFSPCSDTRAPHTTKLSQIVWRIKLAPTLFADCLHAALRFTG